MKKILQISPDFALPLDAAGEAIAILATRGAGKSYTSAVLAEELRAAEVQTIIIDPTGVYWGLRSSAKGTGDGLPIIVLGGAHGDVPLAETAGKLIADLVVDTGQSLVLDLSDFESDGAQCRFMTDFAERLYRRKARTRTTLHLIVDEADEFAPQRPQKNEARMVGAMAKLVRRGRSRGIGLTLITQRSAALNKNLLDLVETLLLMRMLGPRDRDAAAGWISHKNLHDEKGVLSSLPALPTGTAWVWSPLRNVLQKVAMRRIETFDSYVTPKPGEVRAEPKALATVDLDKLGEQIKATAEKAKADDPAALRRRIAELEAQAKARTPDQFEIEDARRAGFQSGLAEGKRLTAAGMRSYFERLNTLASALTEHVQGGVSDLGKVASAPAKPAQPAPPVVTQSHPKRDTRPPLTSRNTVRGDTISGPQQRILDALAWWESAKVPCPSRVQVAVVARYAPNGGSFQNPLGGLRSAGLVEYPSGGTVRMTDAGRALSTPPLSPVSTADLHAMVRAILNGPQWRILEPLLNAYPDDMTRDDLAAAANYEVGGGSFQNPLGSLRTLGLVDYPSPGRVVAQSVMFI